MPDDLIEELSYEPSPEEIDEAESPRRSLWGLVTLVVTVIVIVIVLMLLRDCGGTSSTGASDDGGRTIETVKGYRKVPGAVSLWIEEDADLATVLGEAGVSAEDTIDMGEGRWVLQVADDTEERSVTALKRVDGVHDAGRVYER